MIPESILYVQEKRREGWVRKDITCTGVEGKEYVNQSTTTEIEEQCKSAKQLGR